MFYLIWCRSHVSEVFWFLIFSLRLGQVSNLYIRRNSFLVQAWAGHLCSTLEETESSVFAWRKALEDYKIWGMNLYQARIDYDSDCGSIFYSVGFRASAHSDQWMNEKVSSPEITSPFCVFVCKWHERWMKPSHLKTQNRVSDRKVLFQDAHRDEIRMVSCQCTWTLVCVCVCVCERNACYLGKKCVIYRTSSCLWI